MSGSVAETPTEAAKAATRAGNWERDQEAWNLPRAPGETISNVAGRDELDWEMSPDARGVVGLVRGRFEAQFEDVDAAKAAARDARSVGFAVDIPRESPHGWLIVGRRKLPFPTDERDRYASRVHAIASRYGGAFSRFVEEPPERADDRSA
jgi:hypothetical protein